MLTDAFFRRYEDVQLFPTFEERHRRFFVQAAQLITTELFVTNDQGEQSEKDRVARDLTAAHDQIAREVGAHYLFPPTFVCEQLGVNYKKVFPYTPDFRITQYLTAAYEANFDADQFITRRLSLVELCFQKAAANIASKRSIGEFWAKQVNKAYGDVIGNFMGTFVEKEKYKFDLLVAAYNRHVTELNERFRQARMPLSYHNGFIQISDDALVEAQVERPFWSIVSQPKWQNVDHLVKEAIDKRDRSERDAVTPAMQALESVIKIISDEKQWTTGNERGAANYINNLVSERNGVRFIEVWEKDALMDLFGKIRNAFGHGPGSQPLPTLKPQQTDWAIDAAMIWIKSLVRRL
ncbi:AbiJ-NTD4 domain-containing protein [Cystobacter fuscus]